MKAASYVSWILLAGLCVAFCVDSCKAQVARYQPRTSTISPYLNLGRFNGGGLPNYYALVRPQVQQGQFNKQTTRVSQLQAQEISSLQTQVQQGTAPLGATSGNSSWFMTPGVEHTFLNTSRFYPQAAPRR